MNEKETNNLREAAEEHFVSKQSIDNKQKLAINLQQLSNDPAPSLQEPLAQIEQNFNAKEFLQNSPTLPGVYRMLDGQGNVLYVGKAKNLKNRLNSYFQKTLSSPRIALMVKQIANIEITVTPSEADALILENNLIKKLNPRYNILFRDDKSYPYIAISKQQFPRISFFRGAPKKDAEYFGPFPSGSSVRESIQYLQKLCRIRTCSESVFANRSRPCLLYQIKRCTAPCVDYINEENYQHDVNLARLFLRGEHQEIISELSKKMEQAAELMHFEEAAVFRDQINHLVAVRQKQVMEKQNNKDVDIIVALQHGAHTVINLAMVRAGLHLGDRSLFPRVHGDITGEEALLAFIEQHYLQHPLPDRLIIHPPLTAEQKGQILENLQSLQKGNVKFHNARSGSEKSWLEFALKNAQISIDNKERGQQQQSVRNQRLLEILQQNGYLLAQEIKRIECFDISHTQGEATVASCVVYKDNAMCPREYRRFNINNIQAGDDYAAMSQVISRRYRGLINGEGVVPDIVLVDGGKGQMSTVIATLAEMGVELFCLGVAKGEGRKAGLETLILPDKHKINLPSNDPALHLIQEIRDEAHRFAISGHRNLRSKSRKVSQLDEIEGIGAKRRKQLITHFGSVRDVAAASVEQLCQIPGISHSLAESIYAALH